MFLDISISLLKGSNNLQLGMKNFNPLYTSIRKPRLCGNFQHIMWKFKRSKTCHESQMIQKEITAYDVSVWAYWLTTTNIYLPTCTTRKLLWPITYNKCNEKLMEHVILRFGWKLGTWCIHSYFRSVTITYECRTRHVWQDITVTMPRTFKIRTDQTWCVTE